MRGRSQSSSIPTRRSKRGTTAVAQTWTVRRALAELARHGDQRNVEGMARFGIRTKQVYGVSKPKLDQLARAIGTDHALGLKLWKTGIHDARLLGMLVSEAKSVTSAQMDQWVRDFDNWDVCDGTCCHLFVDAKPAWKKAFSWTSREKEFEKRAGFALAAFLAIHDRAAGDAPFLKFMKVIEREAWDERNFVRKAVNWALRNIGKRNRRLNRAAIQAAERIQRGGTRAGRWVAADALRELKSQAVQKRLLKERGLRSRVRHAKHENS
jgi:3-methyladenine DNA glycosylase AlkD